MVAGQSIIRRSWLGAVLVLAMLVTGLVTPPAQAAAPPNGSTWSETYIPTPDGESLHVDVLRPEGLSDEDKTPVILIVSPYIGEAEGPNNRFYDFIEGAQVFDRGYSVVQVSLRGTGGSSGCLDILGPGEQTDVVTAVKWAASQPWSTGSVGMYGKSYDANTGAVAAATRPPGLKAIVAQAIAPDRYRGSYNDRVRLLQSAAYPAIYGLNGEGQGYPGRVTDPTYSVNALSRGADCQALLAEHYLDDEQASFWRSRDFVDRAEGSTIPTFVTAGYLDNATNVGAGVLDFFNALAGPKKLWVGWWAHDRGNDTVDPVTQRTCTKDTPQDVVCELAMGRAGFFDEVMRFYDEHLKDAGPLTAGDPVIAAQSSDGTWRSEESFPPADARDYESNLLSGAYQDNGANRGSRVRGPGGFGVGSTEYGAGVWTFSPPLAQAEQLTGIPTATIDVKPEVPRTNVVVNVYDISPEGDATMLTRGAALADTAGPKDVLLWPTDWIVDAGHRIGVLVSGANREAFTHVPTRSTVTVTGGQIRLPFLDTVRTSNLPGASSPRLENFKMAAPFTVSDDTIESGTNPDFVLPE